MPLVAAALQQEMMSATEEGTEKGAVLPALADSIGKYIKDNAKFLFAWTAANPLGSPDPVTIATGGFENLVVTFSSLMSATPDNGDSAFSMMGADIITSFTSAIYNIKDPGFGTSPGVFGSSPTLGTLVLSPSNATERDLAFLDLADSIINWVKSQVPLTPCSGTHSAFTGAGLVTSIL